MSAELLDVGGYISMDQILEWTSFTNRSTDDCNDAVTREIAMSISEILITFSYIKNNIYTGNIYYKSSNIIILMR
jgi:hypothetical protein